MKVLKSFKSKDGKTIKYLQKTNDGHLIETSYFDLDEHIICISTQIGCPMGCIFCATAKPIDSNKSFIRNLTTEEIVQQVKNIISRLQKQNKLGTKSILFSYMGMGEPFLNYDAVMKAVRLLNDQEGLSMGARHMSISTSGVVEGITKLARENLQINLAISLHAPNDALRSKLMPINKKYPIKKLLAAADNFIAKTNKQVMIEYIMIDGINDSDACAMELADTLTNPLFMVNLIPYNSTFFDGNTIFKSSPPDRIKKFMNLLLRKNIHVRQRYKFGGAIKAACGQLATD